MKDPVKMTIVDLDNGSTLTVLYNPTTYTVEDSNKWQDQEATGRKSELQYTGGERRKLSMELFFDTYEKKQDVREHTGQLAAMTKATVDDGGDGKRPPVLKIFWGSAGDHLNAELPFKCVLESLKQQFTFFDSQGTPVRAKVSVTFKEFLLPVEEQKGSPGANSFPAQLYTVQSGDTPSLIAGKLWKDPARWREIAQANNIDNPLRLEVGRELLIPRIE